MVYPVDLQRSVLMLSPKAQPNAMTGYSLVALLELIRFCLLWVAAPTCCLQHLSSCTFRATEASVASGNGER